MGIVIGIIIGGFLGYAVGYVLGHDFGYARGRKDEAIERIKIQREEEKAKWRAEVAKARMKGER